MGKDDIERTTLDWSRCPDSSPTPHAGKYPRSHCGTAPAERTACLPARGWGAIASGQHGPFDAWRCRETHRDSGHLEGVAHGALTAGTSCLGPFGVALGSSGMALLEPLARSIHETCTGRAAARIARVRGDIVGGRFFSKLCPLHMTKRGRVGGVSEGRVLGRAAGITDRCDRYDSNR